MNKNIKYNNSSRPSCVTKLTVIEYRILNNSVSVYLGKSSSYLKDLPK